MALLSADGTRLAYLLERVPTGAKTTSRPPLNELEYSLAVGEADGSQRLIAPWSARGAMMPTDWTPDARHVLGSYMVPPYTGDASIVLWPADRITQEPDRVLVGGRRRVWQAKFSPDGRWISFVAQRANLEPELDIAVVPASGAPEPQWMPVAPNHRWPDKPRWAPDGRTLYFISRGLSSYFNVWGIRMNPDTGTPVSESFQVTHFDSPALMIDPDLFRCEIALARRHLVLSMQSTSGSIWMLPEAPD
jgi:Tol biopolymer transport system component